MMQRSSGTMVRNVLIGSICVILLLVVLYYMKRVEVGRLKHDMDDMLLQRSDREDELNRKLTEYLQKLEDMTRQLGDINSRLQECEDNKASVVMEVQKCKSVHSECLSTKEGADSNLKTVQAELDRLKSQQQSVNSQLTKHNQDLTNVKHSLDTAEQELESCEREKDSLTNSVREAGVQIQECQQRELACQASVRGDQARYPRMPVLQGQGGQPNNIPDQLSNNAGYRSRNQAPLMGGNFQPGVPIEGGPPPGRHLPPQQQQAHDAALLARNAALPARSAALPDPSQTSDEGDGEDRVENPLLEGLVNEDEDDADDDRVVGDRRVNGGGEHQDEERPIVLDDEADEIKINDENRAIDGGAGGEEPDRERALADESLV